MSKSIVQLPLAEERYAQILSELSQKGSLRTGELADKLNVSQMTIRRDLDVLEERDFIKRIHGGATLKLDQKDHYAQRHTDACPIKDRIALQVIQHIEALCARGDPPSAIYLDSGTTAMAVVRQLCAHQQLPAMTLVMHGVNIAYELVSKTHHTLHLIGGEIYQNTYSTFGDTALTTIEKLCFDLFLLGASGFNEEGFSNTNYIEVSIKKAVINRSRSVWMMLDSSKWQKPNLAKFCGYGELDKLFLGPAEHPMHSQISAQFPSLELIHCR